MNLLRAAWLVLRKDLRIEMRTGEVVVTTAMFATLVTVIASLSFFVEQRSAKQVAPGVLWIAVAFSGVLAMSRSWSRERDHDVLRGLLQSPIPRSAIYLGKSLGTVLFLAIVEVVLVLEVAVLFNLDLAPIAWQLALLLALGTLGFAATGNLFAAMGTRTSARDMVLAVALFPVISPALLCGVVATRELLAGAPISELGAWLRILGAFDLAFVTAGMLLFEPLVSD
ncbi:MAG TPA: heme exporter protein CcmB [Polyangiales bacterium]|nr:heme exporter protein CcmB [Polyangiales bacterium]